MPSLLDLAWPVRTERLVLRPLHPDDLDALWALRGDPEVTRWVGRSPTSREDVAAHFLTAEDLARSLAIEHDGALVGDLMIEVSDAWAQHEVAHRARGAEATLGWTLLPRHQGRGFMTEAVREALRICFADEGDGGLGVRRVKAECFAANEPSWRLMERIGMRREGHAVADSLHRDLGWIDGLTYALLDDEWRDRATGA